MTPHAVQGTGAGRWIAPLHLVAQPIVWLASGQLLGVEVLTRVSVTSGPAPRPDQYWATATAIDPRLTRQLDAWVWREAGRYVRDLGRACVNTTPDTLLSGPPVWEAVEVAFTACEIPHPEGLPPAVWELLAAYQARGGWVVWDASRPEHLQQPPLAPNAVKIPRAWSHHIADRPEAAAQVTAWLTAIRDYGAVSIALGVERREDAAWFQDQGADAGQGFYWGAPTGLGGLR